MLALSATGEAPLATENFPNEHAASKISPDKRIKKAESTANIPLCNSYALPSSLSPKSNNNVNLSRDVDLVQQTNPQSNNQTNNGHFHIDNSSNFDDVRIKKSISSQSISSSFNSSTSQQTADSGFQSNKSGTNSFSKEIKNLLEIAENRTKQLCKVYDSSLSENENTAINNNLEKAAVLRSRQELAKVAPNDYKKIINLNYMNSSKKQSNVITKVKLWDQLLESGKLSNSKWEKEFN
jgi:hypothetical protein